MRQPAARELPEVTPVLLSGLPHKSVEMKHEREEWWRSNVDFAAALREGRPSRRPKKRCPVCKGWWFVGEVTGGNRKRVDALYCSPRCRTRAYRQRQSRSEGVTP
ncbi:hypothetical protein ABZ402_47380 [Streptomyces mirabilis]|uniref:hypothetical protein n=1 Tax=Streptomyces mirabilis TaxID=68239 RepID=UPI0033D6BAC6